MSRRADSPHKRRGVRRASAAASAAQPVLSEQPPKLLTIDKRVPEDAAERALLQLLVERDDEEGRPARMPKANVASPLAYLPAEPSSSRTRISCAPETTGRRSLTQAGATCAARRRRRSGDLPREAPRRRAEEPPPRLRSPRR